MVLAKLIDIINLISKNYLCRWYLFDDNKVSSVDVQRKIVTSSAYILLYVQVDASVETNLPKGKIEVLFVVVMRVCVCLRF